MADFGGKKNLQNMKKSQNQLLFPKYRKIDHPLAL